MANKFKGEITLENGMVMVMSYNSLAEFEELTGKGALEALDQMDKGGVKLSELRAFYYACLKRHQPGITIDEAGDVMGDYPDALQEVIAAATPEQGKQSGNGRKPAAKK